MIKDLFVYKTKRRGKGPGTTIDWLYCVALKDGRNIESVIRRPLNSETISELNELWDGNSITLGIPENLEKASEMVYSAIFSKEELKDLGIIDD